MAQNMPRGDCNQNMWTRMYQGIGAAISSAWNLWHRNVQQQTVCVWPPGDRVQKQTGYCGLGTSRVNVGAKEYLYGRAQLGWAAVSWAWLGWAGLGWAWLAGLGWAGLDSSNHTHCSTADSKAVLPIFLSQLTLCRAAAEHVLLLHLQKGA